MGYPKPWLPYNKEQNFAEKIVHTYQSFACKKMVLVLNIAYCQNEWQTPFDKISGQIEVVQNQYPAEGKLFSLRLAIPKLLDCDYVFIQNIDNPFVSVPLLKLLAKHITPEGYTTPTFEQKGGHPILVSQAVIQSIHEFKDYTYDSNLRDILAAFNRTKIAVPSEEILININTQEDYALLFGHSIL